MKREIAIIGATFAMAYVMFQIVLALLQPLFHALSGRLN